MGGTFPAMAGFEDSDFFEKAIKMVLKCILNVILHRSGIKLLPSPTHGKEWSNRTPPWGPQIWSQKIKYCCCTSMDRTNLWSLHGNSSTDSAFSGLVAFSRMSVHTCVTGCAWNGGYIYYCGHPFWGCTFGGVYTPYIYSHASWSYCRRFRSLLLCPLSVECHYFRFVDSCCIFSLCPPKSYSLQC